MHLWVIRDQECWRQVCAGHDADIADLCVQVWASKWSERAWLSRRARSVPDSSLYMAVLLQQVHLCYIKSI